MASFMDILPVLAAIYSQYRQGTAAQSEATKSRETEQNFRNYMYGPGGYYPTENKANRAQEMAMASQAAAHLERLQGMVNGRDRDLQWLRTEADKYVGRLAAASPVAAAEVAGILEGRNNRQLMASIGDILDRVVFPQQRILTTQGYASAGSQMGQLTDHPSTYKAPGEPAAPQDEFTPEGWSSTDPNRQRIIDKMKLFKARTYGTPLYQQGKNLLRAYVKDGSVPEGSLPSFAQEWERLLGMAQSTPSAQGGYGDLGYGQGAGSGLGGSELGAILGLFGLGTGIPGAVLGQGMANSPNGVYPGNPPVAQYGTEQREGKINYTAMRGMSKPYGSLSQRILQTA